MAIDGALVDIPLILLVFISVSKNKVENPIDI